MKQMVKDLHGEKETVGGGKLRHSWGKKWIGKKRQ